MSPNEIDRLEHALDEVCGRASGADVDALAWARSLREARLAEREAPACPRAVLRRAQAIFRERGVARVLRLVYDSWRDAAPAARGPGHARNLRYEAGDHALDVRVTRPVWGEVLLQVAALPAAPGLTVQLDLEGVRRRPRFPLDEHGTGQIRLPPRARAASVRVSTRDRVLMQVAEVPLE